MANQTPLSKDHPHMLAWEAFKQTEDFRNAKRWAANPPDTDGSLWAVFIAGRDSVIATPQPADSALMFADNGDDIEARMAHDAENACPACGGSGHMDDVPEEMRTPAAPLAQVPDGFYLACFRHSSPGKALWWGPNWAGYTPYLEQAGIYTEKELRGRGYFDAPDDVPVPTSFARGLAVSVIDIGHEKARPFWRASSLRYAIAAQSAKGGV